MAHDLWLCKILDCLWTLLDVADRTCAQVQCIHTWRTLFTSFASTVMTPGMLSLMNNIFCAFLPQCCVQERCRRLFLPASLPFSVSVMCTCALVTCRAVHCNHTLVNQLASNDICTTGLAQVTRIQLCVHTWKEVSVDLGFHNSLLRGNCAFVSTVQRMCILNDAQKVRQWDISAPAEVVPFSVPFGSRALTSMDVGLLQSTDCCLVTHTSDESRL